MPQPYSEATLMPTGQLCEDDSGPCGPSTQSVERSKHETLPT